MAEAPHFLFGGHADASLLMEQSVGIGQVGNVAQHHVGAVRAHFDAAPEILVLIIAESHEVVSGIVETESR